MKKMTIAEPKPNTGLDIPAELVRATLETLYKKKLLSVKKKKYHVMEDLYLMMTKNWTAPPAVVEAEKVNRSSSKRLKLADRQISFCELTILQDEKKGRLVYETDSASRLHARARAISDKKRADLEPKHQPRRKHRNMGHSRLQSEVHCPSNSCGHIFYCSSLAHSTL